MKIEEIMARSVAGHYGVPFDLCPRNRSMLKAMLREGLDVDLNDQTQEEHIDAMKDVIAALEQAGYQIVPVEPTKEMLKAGMSANVGPRVSVHGYIYKAMIKQAKEDM